MASSGRRSGRAAARRAQVALESTPKAFDQFEDEDESMGSGEGEDEVDSEIEPQPGGDEDHLNRSRSILDEEAVEDDESPKSPTPAPEPIIRKRRLGRPPKNRPPDWDQLPIDRDTEATPRRRGRGGYRGRGGRKGQPVIPTQQAIDADGTMADIANDELVLPEDAEGEKKVDRMGHLQGGREYRCRTFTVVGRGDRLYMLSTEPARCVGFRDSYLFFTKHRRLYKIIVNDEEKRDMIERHIIPHSYKGRSIGIVTARSVFREFGASIIVGGKKIVDDYEVAKNQSMGAVEGELADPGDVYDPNKGYNKNQYVAWHGASQVYHNNNTAAPQQVAGDTKKKRVAITDDNWQLEHARAASQFNSSIARIRLANRNGAYNIHTNNMMYPATMQPTRARFEQVPPSEEEASASAKFPPVEKIVARNFLILDYFMESPPAGVSHSSYDRPFRNAAESKGINVFDDILAPFRGLSAVSDEIKDNLPPACRMAFDDALEKETEWHEQWGPEAEKAARQMPVIDKAIQPYPKPLN